MLHGKTLAAVIPAYNEERQIARVIETMPECVDRIYVIDDASRDQTVDVVKGCAERDARVVLICRPKNGGVGAATVTGYKQVLADGLDVAVVMGGDAQMPPDDLPRIAGPVAEGRADYVKNNRLFTGNAWTIIPHHRYIGNSILSMLTKIVSGYWHVVDSQAGYTAISREALQLLDLDRLYPRYGFPNDVLVGLNVYDMKVMDVPTRPVYNVGERSGIRLRKVVPTISWLLFRRFFWRLKEKYIIRDFHPLVFFYFFGGMLFFPGVIMGLWLLYHRIFTGRVEATSALFAVFMVVTGLQFLLFAMWFDMDHNKRLK